MSFLPITKSDAKERGWDYVDFVLVTGDAYVDHPSFGTAIISRVLEAKGYKVGIIAQPNINNTKDISRFGKPRLGFMVNSGNIDSMVAHYTSAKKKRREDAYSPGGKSGFRPDRAVEVYCKIIRQKFFDVPIIIGGIEASLRRFAHYDYWTDSIMKSILISSGADLLVYGMGENQTIQIANRLNTGENISDITDIKGTCYITKIFPQESIAIPSYTQVCNSKEKYAQACKSQYENHDFITGKILCQQHDNVFLIQNPPMPVLTTEELDWVYSLPYERYYHPSYESLGGVPAIKEVEFSIIHNRGCFGACNFCSIAYHQGRQVAVRSQESVIDEAKKLTENPHFKGYIHDVGGPTANFRLPSCKKQIDNGFCKNKKCLAPNPCKNLQVNHTDYISLLKKIRQIPKIKKVFIRSGIRFDYLLQDESDEFFKELIKNHVSGQLKVAPEHCSDYVLDKMGKPNIEVYKKFSKKFYEYTKSINKEQYLVPYLMSSHPGSTLKDAVELALFLKKEKIRPEQVQDFYPTPGTISTCMYYTGLDPYTFKPVFVPKTFQEKALQRALLQYFKPENRKLVVQALKKVNREDLIGTGKNCLIPPTAGYEIKKQSVRKTIKAKGRWDPKNSRGRR